MVDYRRERLTVEANWSLGIISMDNRGRKGDYQSALGIRHRLTAPMARRLRQISWAVWTKIVLARSSDKGLCSMGMIILSDYWLNGIRRSLAWRLGTPMGICAYCWFSWSWRSYASTWYGERQGVCWWCSCHLGFGCGQSGFLASLRPPVMASHRAVPGPGGGLSTSSTAYSSCACWLPSMCFCSHARMRAMVCSSHSDICWAVLAAVVKSSWISGSRRLSMPSCSVLYWMPSLVGHSWLWSLLKNLHTRCVHGPASDWPPNACNVLCPWLKAAWRGGALRHYESGHCVPGAYSLSGRFCVLGPQPPTHLGSAWCCTASCSCLGIERAAGTQYST